MSRPETGSVDDGAAAPSRRATFGFIFVSAVTSAMSIGIMVPILPNLLKQFVGGDTAAATEWNVVFATCGGVMSFLAGPILGLLSDRFGRRPVLLISLSGLGLDFLFMAFAPTLAWLFVGRLISGATSGVFSTANAYVADVTPPERRARAFGWMGSAFSVGFLAGPAIGGLLGQYNLRLPFMAAAALTLANAVYGALVLPESLPRERRTETFRWRRANPIGSLALLRSHPDLMGLAGIQFLNQLAQMVWPSIFVLYTSYRYGWTPVVTGFYMMVGSLMGIGVQTFLVGPVVRRIGERGYPHPRPLAACLGIGWHGLALNRLALRGRHADQLPAGPFDPRPAGPDDAARWPGPTGPAAFHLRTPDGHVPHHRRQRRPDGGGAGVARRVPVALGLDGIGGGPGGRSGSPRSGRGGATRDRQTAWADGAVALAGSLLSGLLWGVGAALMFPADETGQWLWIFLIAGMCAGAATLHSRASHRPPWPISCRPPRPWPTAHRPRSATGRRGHDRGLRDRHRVHGPAVQPPDRSGVLPAARRPRRHHAT